MSKQTEQQDETAEQVLKLPALEPNTKERSKREPEMSLNFDMPEEIMGFTRQELRDHLKKFEM